MTVTALGPRELSRQTGVSTDTLRHYERRGLLRAQRTANGYRRYAPEVAARVLLIQRALVLGFTLSELKEVLRERDGGGTPCGRVRALVAEKLHTLDQRLRELTALKHEMTAMLKDWDRRLTRSGPRPAHLLETLSSSQAIETRRSSAASGRRRRPSRVQD